MKLIISIIFTIVFYIVIIKAIIKFIKKYSKKRKNNNKEIINYNYNENAINYYKKQKELINKEFLNKDINNNENYNKFYKPKIYLITLNEAVFYNVLLEIAKELDLILCSQVSLYNIIEIKSGLDKSNETKYFNKISRKSIDFVLVDKKNCRIRLCIELDDNTHKKYTRIERDKFINKLFKDLNINLLRMPSRFHYNKDELKNLIENNISKNYYEYN